MANHLSFDMLNRLVESRGSIAEEATARRHLVRCGRCRSELEWLQRIQGVPGRLGDFVVDSVDLGERSDALRLLRGV